MVGRPAVSPNPYGWGEEIGGGLELTPCLGSGKAVLIDGYSQLLAGSQSGNTLFTKPTFYSAHARAQVLRKIVGNIAQGVKVN